MVSRQGELSRGGRGRLLGQVWAEVPEGWSLLVPSCGFPTCWSPCLCPQGGSGCRNRARSEVLGGGWFCGAGAVKRGAHWETVLSALPWAEGLGQPARSGLTICCLGQSPKPPPPLGAAGLGYLLPGARWLQSRDSCKQKGWECI